MMFAKCHILNRNITCFGVLLLTILVLGILLQTLDRSKIAITARTHFVKQESHQQQGQETRNVSRMLERRLGKAATVDARKQNPEIKKSRILTESSKSRKQRISEVCPTLLPLPEATREQMRKHLIHYTLADDVQKSLYCTISKAGSTTVKYYLVQRQNPNLPEQFERVHYRDFLKKYGLKFLNEYTSEEVEYRFKNYFKYLVTRDPFERLVSTHRDKFLQEHEGFYRNKVGERIKQKYRPTNISMEKDLELWEFLKFVANGDDPVNYDRHWMPQFYVCDPCSVHYDYVAKVETLGRDMKNIFKRLDISWTGLSHQNSHGQKDQKSLASYYSAINSSDLQHLSDIYQLDMDVFGYSTPW